MLKIRSIVPVAALALLAACGADEPEVEAVDTTAEPAAVVTPPVTTVPAATDPAVVVDPAVVPADTTPM